MSSDEDMGGVDLIAAFKKGSKLPEARTPPRVPTAPMFAPKPAERQPAAFSGSDEERSAVEEIAAPAPKSAQQPHRRQQSSSSNDSGSVIEDNEPPARSRSQKPIVRKAVAVTIRTRPPQELADFTYYEPKEEVVRIVREATRRGDLVYEVAFANGKKKQVSDEWLPSLESRGVAYG